MALQVRPAREEESTGSLTFVGTGIRLAAHLTAEARAHIEGAGKLLHMVADPVTAAWLRELNPTAEPLERFSGRHKCRRTAYDEMVEEILVWVRRGLDVCVAAYGHPAVFVTPSHEAVRRARAEGFPARMLPGVSAADCLFADLEIDPGDTGCQMHEATDFLMRRPAFDPGSLLVLWQIAAIGRKDNDFSDVGEAVETLSARLAERYGGEHEVALYEAALYPGDDAAVRRIRLVELAGAALVPVTTLVVPPLTT